jgi:cell division septal protein FtsQ
MEIHTNRARTEREQAAPAPDQSRYLRRKATQRLRKSHVAGRRLLGVLRVGARLGGFFLAVACPVFLLLYAYNSDQFALRSISIQGCRHLDTRQLEQTIAKNVPANLLRLDLRQVRRLVESQNWVRRVEIHRLLPSNLVIRVEERAPSVVVEIQGELMLTDDDGVLLDRYDTTRYGKLDVPVFRGLLGDGPQGYRLYQGENSARIKLGRELLSELESGSPVYTKSISEVDLSDKNNLKILLVDDTAEIFLGDRDFLKRFQILMSNLTQYEEVKSEYSDIAVVDLRFDGNIIYRPARPPGQHHPDSEATRGDARN